MDGWMRMRRVEHGLRRLKWYVEIVNLQAPSVHALQHRSAHRKDVFFREVCALRERNSTMRKAYKLPADLLPFATSIR